MNRTTAQRLGDITAVLFVVAALSLVAVVWQAFEAADGSAHNFWSFLGSNVTSAVFPAFASACLYGWMDRERQPMLAWPIVGVLALSVVGIVGTFVLGSELSPGGQRSAIYLLRATFAFMAIGGIALVKAYVPQQFVAIREEDEETDE